MQTTPKFPPKASHWWHAVKRVCCSAICATAGHLVRLPIPRTATSTIGSGRVRPIELVTVSGRRPSSCLRVGFPHPGSGGRLPSGLPMMYRAESYVARMKKTQSRTPNVLEVAASGFLEVQVRVLRLVAKEVDHRSAVVILDSHTASKTAPYWVI